MKTSIFASLLVGLVVIAGTPAWAGNENTVYVVNVMNMSGGTVPFKTHGKFDTTPAENPLPFGDVGIFSLEYPDQGTAIFTLPDSSTCQIAFEIIRSCYEYACNYGSDFYVSHNTPKGSAYTCKKITDSQFMITKN